MIELFNIKNLHSDAMREHGLLMAEVTKIDNKKDLKRVQKEIDILYKLINDINKLLALYKENE